MVGLLSVGFVLASAVMGIAFIVMWLTMRKEVKPYQGVGYFLSILLILFELIILIANLGEFGGFGAIFGIVVADTIAFFRLVAVTTVGIYYCLKLGTPSFPKLMRLLWGERMMARRVEQMTALPRKPQQNSPTLLYSGVPILVDPAMLSPVLTTAETTPDNQEPESLNFNWLRHVSAAEYWGVILAVVVAAVAYSAVLFLTLKPSVSEVLRGGFTDQELLDQAISVTSIVVALEFALVEELFFRLGLQSFLSYHLGWVGRRYWGVVLLTAVFWTVGHVGALDPNWVKLVQIFPVGVALGWMFKRYGAGNVIIAHALFNFILILLSPYLIF